MSNKLTTIDISTNTIARIIAITAFIFLLLQTWEILASIFLAIVIAAALEPSLRWLEEHKMRRIVSVPTIYLIAILIFVGTFYVILPGLFSEINTLSLELPDKINSSLDSQVDKNSHEKLGLVASNVENILQNLQDTVGSLVGDIAVFITTIFGGVVSLLFMIVASFYLSLDRREVERFLTDVTPVAHRDYISDLWGRIQKRLGNWLQAQFILAVFMGTSVFVMLTILDSSFALTLGILAGFLEIIPFLGPLIAAALIFGLISVETSIIAGLIALAAYIIFQQIEQNFILPTVMSRVIGSNPLVILTAALVGAELLGFWGVILAIPMVAVLGEIMRDFQVSSSVTKENKKQ